MKFFNHNGCGCPRCGSGVLEPVGYFELKPGPVALHFSFFLPDQTPAMQILVCSLDQCGYVQMEAAPGSLSHAKHEIRNTKHGSCRI